jgi:hypothetical protein
MSLLSCSKANRAIVLCTFSIVLFLIFALPVPSPVQNRISSIGPTVVWAGSPDETLNPPPTPKKSARIMIVAPGTTANTISGRTLFMMVLRMYWATVRL